MALLERLLRLLEKYLPSLLLAFGIGYKAGAKDKGELEGKLLDKEVELELEKNRRALEAANKGLDSRSIVRRAIESGRDLLRRNK